MTAAGGGAPRPAAAAGLHAAGLVKRYRGAARPSVDGVDLHVPTGSMTALLGPSGCGKTTVLKLVAGLLDPDAGSLRLDDRDLGGLPAEARPVGMVFQRPLLFPHLSVADNVGFGLRMRRVPRRLRGPLVADMLRAVQLDGYGSRAVHQLSGGQEQRVALARALVTAPRLLLLDEPLSSLDTPLRVEMRELIRALQRERGITAVFVTHDQEEAVAVADDVVCLFDGRVAQRGSPRSVLAAPVSARVAAFLGNPNAVPAQVRGATVHSVLGAWALPGHHDGPVLLLPRPEDLTVRRPGPDDPAAPPAAAPAPLLTPRSDPAPAVGTVRRTRFVGAADLLAIDLDPSPAAGAGVPGAALSADTPLWVRVGADDGWEVGARVVVTIDPARCPVVPAGPRPDDPGPDGPGRDGTAGQHPAGAGSPGGA